MAIPDWAKQTLQTIIRAAKSDDLALMECEDAQTREKVNVVCAVNIVEDEYQFVPLAKLFSGNPYEELIPPTDGGRDISSRKRWQPFEDEG